MLSFLSKFAGVVRGVLHGFDRAGVNALPEFMRRALRDDGDGIAFRSGIRLAATQTNAEKYHKDKGENCFHWTLVENAFSVFSVSTWCNSYTKSINHGGH